MLGSSVDPPLMCAVVGVQDLTRGRSACEYMTGAEVDTWDRLFAKKTTLLADVNVLDGEQFPRLTRYL
jgi:hypothetical protein